MTDETARAYELMTTGCPPVPGASYLDCGTARGNPQATSTARIGSGSGVLRLIPQQHGSTWRYDIYFHPESGRPTRDYRITEVASRHPDVVISTQLPAGYNCVNGRRVAIRCWTAVLTLPQGTCGLQAGSGATRRKMVLCEHGVWHDLSDVARTSLLEDLPDLPEELRDELEQLDGDMLIGQYLRPEDDEGQEDDEGGSDLRDARWRQGTRLAMGAE